MLIAACGKTAHGVLASPPAVESMYILLSLEGMHCFSDLRHLSFQELRLRGKFSASFQLRQRMLHFVQVVFALYSLYLG